jgi:hypothetical protein
MMLVHLLATIAGVLVLIGGPFGWLGRGLIVVLLQLLVPALTVAYRAWRGRRAMNIPRGVFLYWLYFWARLQALVLVLRGNSDAYVK